MHRQQALGDTIRAEMAAGGNSRWDSGSSSFGRQWRSTGEDCPAVGGSGKWVPDLNPLAAAGGEVSLASLTIIYFSASFLASSAVFACGDNGV